MEIEQRLRDTIAAQAKEIERLRAFAQKVQDDWAANQHDDDDWSEGYDDCLCEYASHARAALSKEAP